MQFNRLHKVKNMVKIELFHHKKKIRIARRATRIRIIRVSTLTYIPWVIRCWSSAYYFTPLKEGSRNLFKLISHPSFVTKGFLTLLLVFEAILIIAH